MHPRSIRVVILTSVAILTIAVMAVFLVPRALASNTFSDVPDSHFAHDFITWLFDNGITAGFPDGTYRPNNNVTRAEMAVFLIKQVAGQDTAGPVTDADKLDGLDSTAFLGVTGKAVDSDKLDGLEANDLVRAAQGFLGVNLTANGSGVVLTMTAPLDGGFLVTLSANCVSFSGTTNTAWDVDITVAGSVAHTRGILLEFNHADDTYDPYDGSATTAFVSVTAGTHDIGWSASRLFGDGSFDCDMAETALFVPFGSDGMTPLTVIPGTSGIGGSDK